mmetsp:Transcript_24007/g.67261  ORF Transcript_24007/g.67261 Transcript_24007/m.67261 type:complete len:439 (+) Transcript_24007:213-1529(+)
MFKGAFKSMKHSAMVGIGKVQVTQDPEFQDHYERLKVQKSVMVKMQTDCRRYLNALKGLSKAHFTLAEDIRDFYLASDHDESSLKDLSVRYFEAADQLKRIDDTIEGELQADFFAPIDKYLADMKNLFKKIEERNRARDDMDQLAYQVQSNPAKQTQHQRAIDVYNSLNQDLLTEMPHVFRMRCKFFDPLFKTLLETQEKCYSELASQERLSSGAANVQRNSVHNFKLLPEGARTGADIAEASPSPYGGAAAGAGAGAAAGAAGGYAAGGGYGGDGAQGGGYGGAQAGGYGGAQAGGYGGAQGGYGAPQGGGYGAGGGGYGAPPPQQGGRAGPQPGYPAQGGGAPPPGGRAGYPPAGRAGYPPAGGAGRGAPPPGGAGGGPQCKALYDFAAEESNELSFKAGDIIVISKADPGSDWWLGHVQGTGKDGLFPSAYVQRL